MVRFYINQGVRIINKKLKAALSQADRKDWELCSYKDLEKFFEDYPYWGYYEYDHCCYGWKKNCWIEAYVKGNWGLTFDAIEDGIKNILCEPEILQAIIDEPARFRKKVSEDEVELFLSLRDKENWSNMDVRFFGFKNQEDAEKC